MRIRDEYLHGSDLTGVVKKIEVTIGTGNNANQSVIKYIKADSEGRVVEVPIGDITGKAATASKLDNTSAIGSKTNPVYFTANGVPSACTYSLNASVPVGAANKVLYYSALNTLDTQSYSTLTSNLDVFTAATSSAAGKKGLVPAPSANQLGAGNFFLRADGVWTVIENKTAALNGTATSLVTTGEKYNWNSAYNWYNTMTSGDTDGTINKWKEVEAFLANYGDSSTLAAELAKLVTLSTDQTITGVKTFSEVINGSITGNAGTANKLKNTVNINGVAFDGSTDITITAEANGGDADTVDGYHANRLYNAPNFLLDNSATSNTYILLATITIAGTYFGFAEFTILFQNREVIDESSFILSGEIRRNSVTDVGARLFYTTLNTKIPRNIYLRSDDGITFKVYIESAANLWTTFYRAIPIVDSGNITYSNIGTTSPISGSVVNITAAKGGNVNYATTAGDAETLGGYQADAFATAEHTHSYLPLSGGIISNNTRNLLLIKNTDSTNQSALWLGGDFNMYSYGANITYYGSSGNLIFSNFKAYANNNTGIASLRITADNKIQCGDVNWGNNIYDMLHTGNYNSYAPKLDGTGATGTWGINISGNADTATKLQTPRTIWGQSFDGTGNVDGIITIKSSAALYQYTPDGQTPLCYVGYDTAGKYTHLYNFSSGTSIQLKDDGNISMPSGNVGIGTTSPSYQLHVVGDIYTTTGFKKEGSSDNYVLLGGGGHKAISDFATADHNHDGKYVFAGLRQNKDFNIPDYGSTSGVYLVHSNLYPPSNVPGPYGVIADFNIGGGHLLLFGGNDNNIIARSYWWTENPNFSGYPEWVTLIHSGNIGSQSVNYATSAGYSGYALSLNSITLPSSTSNAANTVWCRFATITFNMGAWCNAAGYFLFSGDEYVDYRGILEYHFRADSSATVISLGELSWITKSHDYASVIAVKAADNVYDLYVNNCTTYNSTRIYHFSANNSSFKWNVGSWTATKPTAAITASDVGRVYYATNAGNVDWSGVTNKPTNVSAFTNDAGYLTSHAYSYGSIDIYDVNGAKKTSNNTVSASVNTETLRLQEGANIAITAINSGTSGSDVIKIAVTDITSNIDRNGYGQLALWKNGASSVSATLQSATYNETLTVKAGSGIDFSALNNVANSDVWTISAIPYNCAITLSNNSSPKSLIKDSWSTDALSVYLTSNGTSGGTSLAAGTYALWIEDRSSSSGTPNYYSGTFTCAGSATAGRLDEIALHSSMATNADTNAPTRIFVATQISGTSGKHVLRFCSLDSSATSHYLTVKVNRII